MTREQLQVVAGHYGWLERRLFEVLGGWVPTVSEPAVKLMLRRHSFEHADHAARWADLRGLDAAEVPPGGALAEVLDAVAEPVGTVDRLAGAYGVVLPELARAYRDLAQEMTGETDRPALRAVGCMLVDDVVAQAEADDVAQGLVEEASAGAHREAIRRWLAAIGGVKPPGI